MTGRLSLHNERVRERFPQERQVERGSSGLKRLFFSPSGDVAVSTPRLIPMHYGETNHKELRLLDTQQVDGRAPPMFYVVLKWFDLVTAEVTYSQAHL